MALAIVLAGLLVSVLLLCIAFRALAKYSTSSDSSYFPKNTFREAYLNLANDPKGTDEECLRVALLKRAMESIRRSRLISEEKPSLMILNQAGAISEDTLKSFLEAEKETSSELFDIQTEAELLQEGWSRRILQEAVALLQAAQESPGQAPPHAPSSAAGKPFQRLKSR